MCMHNEKYTEIKIDIHVTTRIIFPFEIRQHNFTGFLWVGIHGYWKWIIMNLSRFIEKQSYMLNSKGQLFIWPLFIMGEQNLTYVWLTVSQCSGNGMMEQLIHLHRSSLYERGCFIYMTQLQQYLLRGSDSNSLGIII